MVSETCTAPLDDTYGPLTVERMLSVPAVYKNALVLSAITAGGRLCVSLVTLQVRHPEEAWPAKEPNLLDSILAGLKAELLG